MKEAFEQAFGPLWDGCGCTSRGKTWYGDV